MHLTGAWILLICGAIGTATMLLLLYLTRLGVLFHEKLLTCIGCKTEFGPWLKSRRFSGEVFRVLPRKTRPFAQIVRAISI